MPETHSPEWHDAGRRQQSYTVVMPAPDIVRVKLSSEGAGSISITPVVVRDLTLRELLEEIASVCGKDAARVSEILRRGSLVSGATRFRWQSLELTLEDATAALTMLPGPDAGRTFTAAHCTTVVFTGPGVLITLPREEGAAHRLFQKLTLWDVVMEIAAEAAYVTYDYRQRADLHRLSLSADHRRRIHEALPTLRNRSLAQRILAAPFVGLEFYVTR